jgi:hypothetical protein
MTDQQREWEEILEFHGLPADRGDTVLDQATYLGNPRAFADEESEYSMFIDSVETKQPWWLEPSGYVVPVRVVTPEELAKLDSGGCALTFFVNLRTKHRRDKWRPELQAARFRGRHHSAETRRRTGEANNNSERQRDHVAPFGRGLDHGHAKGRLLDVASVQRYLATVGGEGAISKGRGGLCSGFLQPQYFIGRTSEARS